MGYSKTNKRAIKKVEPYLKQMVDADGTLEFPADDAGKFSYALREGIRVSKHFAVDEQNNLIEPYVSYSRLNSKYIIRTKGMMVVCEPRDVVPAIRLREVLGQISIPEVKDTLGLLGAAIMHKAPIMIFPNANSETVEEPRLKAWADNNGYALIVSDNHVTLKKVL